MQTQRDTFAAAGYLVLKQLCDKTMLEPVRQHIADRVDEHIRAMHAAGQIDALYAAAPFEQRWALAARDYKRNPAHPLLSRNWGQHTMLGRAIYDLLTCAPLVGLATDLLGEEVTANGDYWIRPKIPNDPSTTFAWHQDSFYYGGENSPEQRILSVWIPLVDTDEKNGCLSFIPGSHRHGAIRWRDTGTGQREPEVEVTAYGQPRPEPVQVGDAIAFDNRTLHASGHNTTESQVRWSIDLRYMPSGQGFAWHALGDEFDTVFPGFIAHSADPTQVSDWATWRDRWQRAKT